MKINSLKVARKRSEELAHIEYLKRQEAEREAYERMTEEEKAEYDKKRAVRVAAGREALARMAAISSMSPYGGI